VRAQEQVLIYERYQLERPNNFEYQKWCEAAAEEHGLSVSQVRRIISTGEKDFLDQVSQASVSKAQQVAGLMGLQLEDAFEILKEQLHATERRPLTDKDGRMQRDCTHCGGSGKTIITDSATKKERGIACLHCEGTGGDVIWLEKPHNAARLKAVKLCFDLFGAAAPDQIEINAKHTHYHVTDAELHSRLAVLLGQVQSLQPASTRQIAGNGNNQPGTDGKKGDRG